MLLPVRANERGLFGQLSLCHGQKSAPRRDPLICPHRCGVCSKSFYREIRTLERPLMSPVRANERGSFVEFFYRATGKNQHLGKARSFACMIRANSRGAFCQFCLRNQLSGEGRSFALNGEGK